MSTAASYERLAAISEAECNAAHAGQLDRVAELQAERERLVAMLPETPPPEAERALKQAAAFQAATSEVIGAGLGELGERLALVQHGRRIAARYAPASEPVRVDRAG